MIYARLALAAAWFVGIAATVQAQYSYAPNYGPTPQATYVPSTPAPRARPNLTAARQPVANPRATAAAAQLAYARGVNPSVNPNRQTAAPASQQQPQQQRQRQRLPVRVAFAQPLAPGVQTTPAMPLPTPNSMPGWNNVPLANPGQDMNAAPMMGTMPGMGQSPMMGQAPASLTPSTPMATGPMDGGPVDGGYAAGGGYGAGAGGGYGPSGWMPPLCWQNRAFGPHCHFLWNSTGDMPQHMPYFPHAHGYYYFRPYNVIHMLQQQEMVARWGLDARNPYDNRFFERIYHDQEAGPAEALPGEPPVPSYWPSTQR